MGAMMRIAFNRSLLTLLLAFSCASSLFAQNAATLPNMASKRILNDLQVTVATAPGFGQDLTVGLVIRYGAAFDPSGKGGLAHLVSRLLLKGTAERSAQGIQDELAYLNATLEIKSDWDSFRFLLKGRSSQYERCLLLLYQIVAEPRFADADFEAVKKSIIQEIRKDPDPRGRIHTQFESVLFSGTTYGRPIEGTLETVTAITLGDVRHLHNRFFSPSQAALVVAGDVDQAAALQRARRIWGVWVRKDDVPFTFNQPRIPAGRQIFIDDDPSSPAAQFVIGNLFPRREDPAYVPSILAAHIFQERLTNLLPTSLVTVGYNGRRLSSPFYVQGQAAADQTLEHIQKIQQAADALKNSPVSAEELAAAQRKITEEFNRSLTTTDGLCNTVLDSELYRLGSNYAVAFPNQVRLCDQDGVRQAANNYVFPSGEILLVRGPAGSLKAALQTIGVPKLLY